MQWRVTELYGAQWRRRRRRCREDGVSGYSGGFLTEWKCRDADTAASQAALQGASGARSPHMMLLQHRRAIVRRLITWRVTELYGE